MVKTPVLLLFAGLLVLVLLPEMEAQRNPPPLCASQYALVNYACAFAQVRPSDDRVYLLGKGQNYTQVQRSDDERGHGHGHGHGRGHGRGRGHGHGNEEGHNHRHRYQHKSGNEHGRGHHRRHGDDDEDGSRNEHGRGHHHRRHDDEDEEQGRRHRRRHDDDEHEHGSRHRHKHRRHGHRHRHHGSSSADECCKWLNELDDECVCYLLVRLPPFLSRQEHKYSIRLGDSCQVSYKCPGRVRL